MTKNTSDDILNAVRKRYAAFARKSLETSQADPAGCCSPAEPAGSGCCETPTSEVATSKWAENLYQAQDLGGVDEAIAELTLGCGNPVAIAELRPGETVLDLGSGAGLDCFLAARQVGLPGRVIGVDMTPEMLELARRNLKKIEASNVEFRQGQMETLPVEDATVDVVISNCVINLSPDKGAVLGEAFRVLKPGGRFRVSDIVWRRPPSESERSDLASWAACVAGALTIDDYRAKLTEAGFEQITIDVADDPEPYASARISARRPG
jgi:SAM-dependent methyltransferase